MRKVDNILKKLISLVLALVMALSIGAVAFAETTQTQINGSNWMSALDGEKFITSINIPGTHDSASKNAMPFNAVTSTQNKTIAQQLYAGVRYLDIRLELTKNGDIDVVHGISKCKSNMGLTSKTLKAEDITKICIDFLTKNPKEAIFLHIREDAGNAGTALYKAFYDKCVKGNENYWYVRNDKPVLNEVRGKIVLLRGVSVDIFDFNDTNSGINFKEYPYISGTELNDFRRRSIIKIDNYYDYANMYVQDSYKLSAKDKCTVIKNFLDLNNSKYEYNICATNCLGSGTPHYSSEIVNKWFMSYPLTQGKVYGLISMDYITDELCEKIYLSNTFVNEPTVPTVNDEEITYSLFGRALELMRNLMQGIESSFAKLF